MYPQESRSADKMSENCGRIFSDVFAVVASGEPTRWAEEAETERRLTFVTERSLRQEHGLGGDPLSTPATSAGGTS